ncbi:MAG: hypothetical protein GY913_28040 [Proteobacteria bacterium]|nr:hypothetical protein [Pseudomonadota bacterium]MCP4920762.1 hypothetical protein [Pseudomonadota bacterium]
MIWLLARTTGTEVDTIPEVQDVGHRRHLDPDDAGRGLGADPRALARGRPLLEP